MFAFVLQIVGFFVLCNLLYPVVLWLVRNVWGRVRRGRSTSASGSGSAWALITGASSGIGEALALKLARKGYRLVLIADPQSEEKLVEMCETLSEIHSSGDGVNHCHTPMRAGGGRGGVDPRHIPIAIDLAHQRSYEVIDALTQGLDIRLVFCNAGVMRPYCGFVCDEADTADWVRLVNINVVSQVAVAHVFMKRMCMTECQSGGGNGTVVFTSSATLHMPTPTVALYAATKAMLAHLAASLSLEVRWRGIDVLAIMPSYTQTRLYDDAPPDTAILHLFQSILPSSPDSVAAEALRIVDSCPHHTTLHTMGWFGLICEMVAKIIDKNVLIEVLEPVMRLSPDFGRHKRLW